LGADQKSYDSKSDRNFAILKQYITQIPWLQFKLIAALT